MKLDTCLFVGALGFYGINECLIQLGSDGNGLFCRTTYESVTFQNIFVIAHFTNCSSDTGKHWWMLWI